MTGAGLVYSLAALAALQLRPLLPRPRAAGLLLPNDSECEPADRECAKAAVEETTEGGSFGRGEANGTATHWRTSGLVVRRSVSGARHEQA